jgi:2,4-dienoyl-CoA reductase-like NADH-dependent reductase (Old Yellow Enzyme family)
MAETLSGAATLAQPLTLPCGAVLPNRFAKAAMSEQLADRHNRPTDEMTRLYARWAAGGTGLLITGNVMVDARALGEARDVVLETDEALAGLTQWALAARSHGAHCWVQLNHPGRQTMRTLSIDPVAPSAVPMKLGGGVFATPRALEEAEILDIIQRFARSAAIVKAAGFTGVQLHGAHGYLISQFLSPHTNRRTDVWGGDAERRMRFVLEVVRAVREAVGPEFPIGVKLNSADFQRGGFDEDASMAVVAALEAEGIDLLEISGGTYEAAAMVGNLSTQRQSTREREAYFLAYAERVRERVRLPLMLTGGFRTLSGMAEAVSTGAVDVVGLGRPLALEPDLPARLLAGTATRSDVAPRRVGIPMLDGLNEILWYTHQLHRMADGRSPDPALSPWLSLATAAWESGWSAFLRRRG